MDETWTDPGAEEGVPATVPRQPLGGRYELLGMIGQGGMGTVWRARDLRAGREVAVKLLREVTPERLERFRREGTVTASLRHSGIVQLHAVGQHEGTPYLVYELIPAARELDLELPREQAVRLVRDAALALGHAHTEGVVHRDVKPSNLLVDPEGRVRVADFGLALAQDLESMTRSGQKLGTPLYMAPELMLGRRDAVGPATDVWSLGVLLYRVLTRQHPFPAVSLPELSLAVTQRRPPPPRQLDPSISPELEAVCLKALDKRPERRQPDGTALALELDLALRGAPAPPDGRRKLLVLRGLIGVLLLALLVTLWLRPRRPASSAATPPALPTPPAPVASGPAPPPATSAASPRPGELRVNPADGSRLVWIPPGRFTMGARRGNAADLPDYPPHLVTLTRGFWLGLHEVTRAQYERFCRATARPEPPEGGAVRRGGLELGQAPPPPPAERGEHPVTNVTWDEAVAYCAWAGLRLPSEAEWERAARGDDDRWYPWGNQDPDPSRIQLPGPKRGTTPVGSFPAGAGPYGCLDQAGNVSEWVLDWGGTYQGQEVVDPLVVTGMTHVARGGGFLEKRPRAHRRYAQGAISGSADLGFRVCADGEPGPR